LFLIIIKKNFWNVYYFSGPPPPPREKSYVLRHRCEVRWNERFSFRHPSTAWYYNNNNNDNRVRLLATKSWTISQLPFVHVYYYNSSYNITNTIKRTKAESSVRIYYMCVCARARVCVRVPHTFVRLLYVQFRSNKLLILKWKFSLAKLLLTPSPCTIISCGREEIKSSWYLYSQQLNLKTEKRCIYGTV